jgi:raffinose/stachyose/melibiose transport system permease protein
MAAVTLSFRKAFSEWKLYLFLLPALVMVAVFSYFPALSGIYHSFFSWGGGINKRFVGGDNYLAILRDPVFGWSFVTIFILIVANLFKMVPSILLATAIHRIRSQRWQYFYRVLLVVPMIIPSLVGLFIWKFFFDPNLGALNALLDTLGLKELLVALDTAFGWGLFFADTPVGWLSQPELVVPALIIWGFPWLGSVGVLIYLAGLQSIGPEIYEAADLDGVTSWQKFLHIELPLIMTQVRLNLILMCVSTLQGFGLPLLLLGDSGGPGGRGMVPGLWMFNRAFTAGEFGYACALGVVLFFFVLALTYVNHRYVRVDK